MTNRQTATRAIRKELMKSVKRFHKKFPHARLRMELDLDALNAALGAYYRVARAELVGKMLIGFKSKDFFTPIGGVKDEYVATELLMSEILQPYQKGFQPKGIGEFLPEILKVRRQKIDFLLDPIELEKSWLGGMTAAGSNPEDFPFEGFLFDKIIERVNTDIEMKLIWNGVYAAPTPGTAGDADTGMDGVLIQVTNAIAASKITPTVTGVLDADNIVDAVEAVYDDVPEELQDTPLIMLMSPKNKRLYKRSYRTSFGANADYKGMKLLDTIEDTECEMLAAPGMSGSNRLIITQKPNLVYLFDGVDEQTKLRTQVVDREIKVLGDLKIGAGFLIIKDLVFTNDQE